MEPLAAFMTNPAGAAIVNATGPIRQIVKGDAKAEGAIWLLREGRQRRLGWSCSIKYRTSAAAEAQQPKGPENCVRRRWHRMLLDDPGDATVAHVLERAIVAGRDEAGMDEAQARAVLGPGQDPGTSTMITTTGIDLADTVLHAVAMGASGKVVQRRKLGRVKLLEVAEQPGAVRVGMEACAGAHHLARTLRAQGHERVRLMPAQYLRPFVEARKNDLRDEEAICASAERISEACRARRNNPYTGPLKGAIREIRLVSRRISPLQEVAMQIGLRWLRNHIDQIMFVIGGSLLVFLTGVVVGRAGLFPSSILSATWEAANDWHENWRHYLGWRSRFDLPSERTRGGVVKHDKNLAFTGYTLVVAHRPTRHGGFNAYLLDMDGRTVNEWDADVSRIWPDLAETALIGPASSMDIHGAHLYDNGDVVLDIGGGRYRRLDRCSNVQWALRAPTHHHVEPLPDGGILTPSTIYRTARPPEQLFAAVGPAGYYMDDTILRIGPDGRPREEKSVIDILLQGGWASALISGPGRRKGVRRGRPDARQRRRGADAGAGAGVPDVRRWGRVDLGAPPQHRVRGRSRRLEGEMADDRALRRPA